MVFIRLWEFTKQVQHWYMLDKTAVSQAEFLELIKTMAG